MPTRDRRANDELERLKADLESEILRHVRRCIENLMDLANGVTVLNPDQADGPKTFQRSPDRAANEYILNRILGRPATRKPLAEPEPVEEKRLDLSKVPLERLETIERWLAEADEISRPDNARRCGRGNCPE